MYWAWFRYITFIRYSFRALMVDHFRGAGDPLLSADGRTTLQFYSMDVRATVGLWEGATVCLVIV